MIQLIHADFRTQISLLKSNFFSLVLTDPPYARQFLPLWESIALAAQRVLKAGGIFRLLFRKRLPASSACVAFLFSGLLLDGRSPASDSGATESLERG
jgi:hypothetical protein